MFTLVYSYIKKSGRNPKSLAYATLTHSVALAVGKR